MRTRRLIGFATSAISMAVVLCMAITTCGQRKQPVLRNAPRLILAINAFSHDCTARGKTLPGVVSLRELVSGGYISSADVSAFDGMDVTISLNANESDPQTILMRARLPDGSVTALMSDGSVQSLRR